MIEIIILFALGYAISWCVSNPDKVKTAYNSLFGPK